MSNPERKGSGEIYYVPLKCDLFINLYFSQLRDILRYLLSPFLQESSPCQH